MRTDLYLIVPTTVVPLLYLCQVAVDLLKDCSGTLLRSNKRFQLRGGFGGPQFQAHTTADVLKLSNR